MPYFEQRRSPFVPEAAAHRARLMNFFDFERESFTILKRQLHRSGGRLSIVVHPHSPDAEIARRPSAKGHAYMEDRDELLRAGLAGEKPVVVLVEKSSLPLLQKRCDILGSGTLLWAATENGNPFLLTDPSQHAGKDAGRSTWETFAHALQILLQVGHVELSGGLLELQHRLSTTVTPLPQSVKPERAVGLSQIPPDAQPVGCLGAAFSFLCGTQSNFSVAFSPPTYPYRIE